MRDEEIFGLLVETNPVADPDGLDSPLALADFGRRSGTDMQTQERTRPLPTMKRRTTEVAAAAFLVVIAAGVGLFLASRADDSGAEVAAEGNLAQLPGTSWAWTDDPADLDCCFDQLTVVSFVEDGTFSVNPPGGNREDAGTYTLDGGVLTFKSSEAYPCAGTTGQYTLTFSEPGRATFHAVSDDCTGRVLEADGLQVIQITK